MLLLLFPGLAWRLSPPAQRPPLRAGVPVRMLAGETGGGAKEPPGKLLDLILQCAIQAQISYYNEFRNELRAKWLASFLGHEHLRVERSSASKDGGRPVYRGLSDGLRCTWREYLQEMLRGSLQKYECRYAVGTPDMDGGPGASAREAAASGAGMDAGAPGWAAASASRAQNPYLNAEPQYREYTELIDPKTTGRGIITICQQLSDEWTTDLEHVLHEGDYLRENCVTGAVECDVGGDGGHPSLLGDAVNVSRAVRDIKVELPPIVYQSFRAASGQWIATADMEEDGTPSPFRAENFDLLQRATTREAALSVLMELDRDDEKRASADWLRQRLEGDWLPRFEAPPRHQLAGLFLLELFSAAPTARKTADGGLGFVDPAAIAEQILEAREVICVEWSSALREGTPAALQSVVAADLEAQLAVEAAGDDDGM